MAEVAGYAARRVHVLALKLTAAQKLRYAGCHGDAAELDAGEADPSHRGAGGEDVGVSGGWLSEGNGAAGAGAGGAVGGGRGCAPPPPRPASGAPRVFGGGAGGGPRVRAP
jgi:hypothetical protein